MHFALEIDEIVHMVVGFVQKNHDLASLLLTCKTFEDHARKRLWQNIAHASILVRLMPSDVVSDDGKILRLADSSTHNIRCPGDWVGPRFKLYARCIKNFEPYTSKNTSNSTRRYPCISASVVDAWRLYHEMFGPSLPVLQALHYYQVREAWSTGFSTSLCLLTSLFHPGIKSLQLDFMDGTYRSLNNCVKVFQAMKELGDTLTTLTITRSFGTGPQNRMSNLLQTTIPHLYSLINFYTNVSMDDLYCLAALPNLAYVSAEISSRFHPPTLMGDASAGSVLFPALEHLKLNQQYSDLEVMDVEALLSTISHISSTRITYLSLGWDRFSPSPRQLSRISEVLSLPSISHSLHEVNLEFGCACRYRAIVNSSAVLPNNSFSFAAPDTVTTVLSLLAYPALQDMRLPMTLSMLSAMILHQSAHHSTWLKRVALIVDTRYSDFGLVPPITIVEELGIMNQLRAEAMDPEVAAPKLRVQFPRLRKLVCMDVTKYERFNLCYEATYSCTCRMVAEHFSFSIFCTIM